MVKIQRRQWRLSEDQILKDNWFLPNKLISDILKRTANAIAMRRINLRKNGFVPVVCVKKLPRKAREIFIWDFK